MWSIKKLLIQNKKHWLAVLFLVFFTWLSISGIGKFETVDEHFWKYERIPEYWQAWGNWNLKKTAVNDKPGITVAFFNGMGLWFVDPTQHRVRDEALTKNDDLTLYNVSQTESLNKALRIPGVLVNAILLFLIYLVSLRVFTHQKVSLLLLLFLSSSPILLGITQIMNPDTYLWSFSFLAFLLWLWFLQAPSYKISLATGVALGFVVLSKYTGLILFPFFFFSLFLFGEDKKEMLWQYIRGFVVASLVALLTLVVFLPATLVKPKLLWKATFGFFADQGVLWPLVITVMVLLTFLFLAKDTAAQIFSSLAGKALRYQRIFSGLFFVLVLAAFLAGIGSQSVIPLEQHFLSGKEDEALEFPLLASTQPVIAFGIKVLVELYTLVFSLHPILLAFLLYFGLLVLRGKSLLLKDNIFLQKVVILVSVFSVGFVIMNLLANVLLNARYSILLFPLVYLFAAFGAWELGERIFRLQKNSYSLLILLLAVLLFATAYQAKPFLFNYTSPLLEKQFVIHDAWGYGLYEAAQYLNALPKENSQPVYVWSDRNGICQFLEPPLLCVSGYKLAEKETPLSYIVISKRGIERGYKPRYEIPETGKSKYVAEYVGIEKNALWRLDILERPDNFIMVVPVQQ